MEVVDLSYSIRPYLCANRQHANLVTICRAANNRTPYRSPLSGDRQSGWSSNLVWQPYRLSDLATWPKPDETATTSHLSRRGKAYQVKLEARRNLLMTGKQKPVVLPM